jgi:hypothetical protein
VSYAFPKPGLTEHLHNISATIGAVHFMVEASKMWCKATACDASICGEAFLDDVRITTMGAPDSSTDDPPSSVGLTVGIVVGVVVLLLLIVVAFCRKPSPPPQQHAPEAHHQQAPPQPAAAVFMNPGFQPNIKSDTRTTVTDSEIYDSLDTENPLAGLSDIPYCTLDEAAAQAQVHWGGSLQAAVKSAKAFATRLARTHKLGVLSEAEAAVINLYTQETPLYRYLNGALGGHGEGGRSMLHHYLPYIKLLQAALLKLPPAYTTSVYRGIRLPLSTLIPNANVGQKVVWWGFTSTSLSKMRSKMFLGFGAEGVGNRTIFQISSNDGRDISQYSSFGAEEEEVILLPGSQFVIDTICPCVCDIEEVQMHQLTAEYATNSDGGEALYAEPVDPPVYDNTQYDLLEDVYAMAGGGVAPVEYAVYAESSTAEGGVNNVNGIDQQYESIGANTAVYADVDAPLVGNGPPHGQATTANVLKCARGDVPSGRTCTRAVGGTASKFCTKHTCNRAGCFNTKSSVAATCDAHQQGGANAVYAGFKGIEGEESGV